jgi:hypothetical protein
MQSCRQEDVLFQVKRGQRSFISVEKTGLDPLAGPATAFLQREDEP